MHIYFSSLQSIEQQSMQLASADCIHCKQSHQLVSHGFIYKKQRCADPVAIGKRVICSNRNRHTGCGRTMRLYLDSAVRYLHYAGQHVVAFVFSQTTGMAKMSSPMGAVNDHVQWAIAEVRPALVCRLSTTAATIILLISLLFFTRGHHDFLSLASARQMPNR